MTTASWILLSCAALLAGFVIGILCAMLMLKSAINRADICEDDKRMIRDVLGIPQ